jgi:hypothetical protein
MLKLTKLEINYSNELTNTKGDTPDKITKNYSLRLKMSHVLGAYKVD